MSKDNKNDCKHHWGEMKYEEPRYDERHNKVADGFHYQRCKECRKIETVK